MFGFEASLTHLASVELSCGAGPVDDEMSNDGLCSSTVVEDHGTNTNLFQYLRVHIIMKHKVYIQK